MPSVSGPEPVSEAFSNGSGYGVKQKGQDPFPAISSPESPNSHYGKTIYLRSAEPSRSVEAIVDLLMAAWLACQLRLGQDVDELLTCRVVQGSNRVEFTIGTGDLSLAADTPTAVLLQQLQRQRERVDSKLNQEQSELVIRNGEAQIKFEIQSPLTIGRVDIAFINNATSKGVSDHPTQLASLEHATGLLSERDDLSVGEILSVTPSELADLWRLNAQVPFAIPACMHDLIADRARRYPTREAVVSRDGNFTYEQVDALSTRLAKRLVGTGAGPGMIIPICFEKSRWTVVAVLATMKSGAAFALMDPSQPAERLATIVSEVKARHVLTSRLQEPLARRIAPEADVTIVVDQETFNHPNWQISSHVPRLLPVSPSSPLYIQFTSGSTGVPKGVICSHVNYTSGAIPRAEAVGYKLSSRVLDFASYAFDVSIDCMLCTLMVGGVLCVPSEEARMNDMAGAILEMDVNMAHMTPSVARVLDPETMAQLDVLGLGGEALSHSDVAVWSKLTSVVNAYGPSECTVGCTINSHPETEMGGYVSIGKGVGGVMWIVDPDDHQRLMPAGAVGELLVEGPIVGLGYLNNQEKSDEVFISDPEWLVAGVPGIPGRHGRLYKTGDLVSYSPDASGSIIFVGRKDSQVKLRGQRIELGEIEHHVRANLPKGTSLCAEIIRPNNGAAQPTLVVFIGTGENSETQTTPWPEELRQHISTLNDEISKLLPVYMVPTAYIPISRIPVMVSNKTDRKKLREIGGKLNLAHVAAQLEEPVLTTILSTVEKKLLQVVAQVLNQTTSSISLDHNFFLLGGDSILAMKLVSAARKEGIEISVAEIFAQPKLAGLASTAKELSGSESEDVQPFSLVAKAEEIVNECAQLLQIDRSTIEDVYPCTPLQEGLMALSAKFPESYVAQRVLELPSSLEYQRLHDAFHVLVETSPILRTRIVQVRNAELVQVVLKPSIGWSEDHTSLDKYLESDKGREMGLTTELVRYGFVSDAQSGKLFFIWTMHHAVYDGWSTPLLIEQLKAVYKGTPLAPRTSFKSFIKHLQQTTTDKTRNYWQRSLQGATLPQFPSLPQPDYITSSDSLLERYIRVDSASLQGRTIATLIRGAWALVASIQSGHVDVVFGETLTGRTVALPGVELIDGPMITTVPIRLTIDINATVDEFLQAIRDNDVNRIPHEHFGLQNIRRLSPDTRDACDLRTGLVIQPKTELSLENSDMIDGLAPANDVEAAREALKFNSYGLMLVCSVDQDGFLVMASFDSQVLDPSRAELVLAMLDSLIQDLCLDMTRKIGSLEYVRAADFGLALPVTNGHLSVSTIHVDSLIRASKATNDFGIDQAEQVGPKTIDNFTTPEQILLRDLWAEALGVPAETIHPESNFFNLGADSITAMKLVFSAKRKGLNFTVADVFKNKTLAKMSAVVDVAAKDAQNTAQTRKTFERYSAIHEDVRQHAINSVKATIADPSWKVIDILPTTDSEAAGVVASVTNPKYSMQYNLMYLDQSLDKERILSCFQQLSQEHEILRSVFAEVDGQILQVVIESLETPVEEFVAEGNLTDSVQQICSKDADKDLPMGSNFSKLIFVKGSEGTNCLVIRLSHAQYDGVSLPMLLLQLADLYEGKSLSPHDQFSSYIYTLFNDVIPNGIKYYQELLRGSQMSNLSPPNSAPKVSQGVVVTRGATFNPDRDTTYTLSTIVLAAWAVVLAKATSCRDVIFGHVVAARSIDLPDCDTIMGKAAEACPVRIPLDASWTGTDLLQFAQIQKTETVPHEATPLSHIIRHCTNWPVGTDWTSTVNHQDIDYFDTMKISGTECPVDALNPHPQPAQEFKVESWSIGPGQLHLQVICSESWKEFGSELLDDITLMVGMLIETPEKKVSEMVGDVSWL